jgi:phosphatidate cytidylyltransferase
VPNNKYSSLQLRVMSACILAPLAITALYFGGIYFAVFLGLASIAMSFEWCRASLSARQVFFTFTTTVTVITALWFSYYSSLSQTVTVLICGAAVMTLMGSLLKQGKLFMALFRSVLYWFAGRISIGYP